VLFNASLGYQVRNINWRNAVVIKKILAHLKEKIAPAGLDLLPQSRATPQTALFKENHHPNDRLQ